MDQIYRLPFRDWLGLNTPVKIDTRTIAQADFGGRKRRFGAPISAPADGRRAIPKGRYRVTL